MPANRLRSIRSRIRAEQRRQDRLATRVSMEAFLPARLRQNARNLRSAYEKLGVVAGEADPADFALDLLDRGKLRVIADDTAERASRDARICRVWDEQHNHDLEGRRAYYAEKLLAVPMPKSG